MTDSELVTTYADVELASQFDFIRERGERLLVIATRLKQLEEREGLHDWGVKHGEMNNSQKEAAVDLLALAQKRIEEEGVTNLKFYFDEYMNKLTKQEMQDMLGGVMLKCLAEEKQPYNGVGDRKYAFLQWEEVELE
jgi:hypothetical protein